MRVARAGYLFASLALLAFLAPGAAPAAVTAAPSTTASPSFKVMISPQYTTAGPPTPVHVTIVNLSSAGTILGSVKLTPPTGFTTPKPLSSSPVRTKTLVKQRTLSVQSALKPGNTKRVTVTTNAPIKCGETVRHWSGQGFEGAAGSGPQLALQSALSSLAVTVLCPKSALCGDGGPACLTTRSTSTGTYTVVSTALAGTLRETVDVGHQLRCGVYRFRDPNWYSALIVPPTSSTPASSIADTVTYKIVNATTNGVGFCLGAAYDFTTASGGQAAAGILPNGDPGFIGLLPKCSTSAPPCIQSATPKTDTSTTIGSDVTMKILIPDNGDPWGHG